jgi:hypothetical protein
MINVVTTMVEKPGPDASNAEIARYMEEDWGESLAEGISEALDDEDQDADETDDSDDEA